ncbi:hypothetical protein ATCC90586_012040 [Pythium insidiosum]|nr:hypothetical protein ATCC90586_012040 [Pythium insidiosum]
MTRFPDGLVTVLPRNLIDIEFAHSNLSVLPDNLDRLWHPLAVLYLEHMGYTAVPPTLTRLPVDELSLSGNALVTLEANWAGDTSLRTLDVGRNPLTALPAEPLGTQLTRLTLEATRLSALPPWARETKTLRVFAGGTPLCDTDKTQSVCHAENDEETTGQVPVDLIAAHRPF